MVTVETHNQLKKRSAEVPRRHHRGNTTDKSINVSLAGFRKRKIASLTLHYHKISHRKL